jgi:hypothetical protein
MPDTTPLPSARSIDAQIQAEAHPERVMGEKPAVVDGSNIAHFGETGASVENIGLVCDKLIEQGWDPIVITDAALRHQNDRFRDREQAFPEARDRIIRYMIVDGEVVLEQRAKQRRD